MVKNKARGNSVDMEGSLSNVIEGLQTHTSTLVHREDIADILVPGVHKDLLRSFTFAVENLAHLVREFEKYTDVIHFDDIHRKVMEALESEYSVMSYLDTKKRRVLVNRNLKISSKEDLSTIRKIAYKGVNTLKNDYIGRALYMVYINLFEEEMKVRLMKIKSSHSNRVFNDIFHSSDARSLAEFLVSKEFVGDDYLFLFPLLYQISNKKLRDAILDRFVGTRQKKLASLFKKEIKGKNYINEELSLDTFGLQSFYNDRNEINNSFHVLLVTAFLEDPDMIEKITNKGAVLFTHSKERDTRMSLLAGILEKINDRVGIMNVLKEQMAEIKLKQEGELLLFDIFLYHNMKQVVDYLDPNPNSKKGVPKFDEKHRKEKTLKMLHQNIIWKGGKTVLVHNVATNKKMDPFINVTLKINGQPLEKQGKIGTSASISSIIAKYHKFLSLQRISDKNHLRVYKDIVKKRRADLLEKQAGIKNEVWTKALRIRNFESMDDDSEKDAKILRFKLQLINKIKNYIVGKVLLDPMPVLNKESIISRLNLKYGIEDIRSDIEGILDRDDIKLLESFLKKDEVVDKILKTHFEYHSDKFLEIVINPKRVDDFFYDIINTCAELNHPIYKWKTEFEAGMKFYVKFDDKNSFHTKEKEKLKRAVFKKLEMIVEDIYQKFLFANYDRKKIYSRFDMKDKILFFAMDVGEMKDHILHQVVSEFLRDNKFVDESVHRVQEGKGSNLDVYVADVKQYLEYLKQS